MINEDTKPTINNIGALIKKLNNICLPLNVGSPTMDGYITQLNKVSVGEIIIKKISVVIRVASNLYLTLPVYVSFGM